MDLDSRKGTIQNRIRVSGIIGSATYNNIITVTVAIWFPGIKKF
jgi:hypothetical protein